MISCSNTDNLDAFIASLMAKSHELQAQLCTESTHLFRKSPQSLIQSGFLQATFAKRCCSLPKYQSTFPAHFPFPNATTEDFYPQNIHPRTPRIRRHRSRIMSLASRGRSMHSGVPYSNSSPGTTPLCFSILSMYSCPRYPSRQYCSRASEPRIRPSPFML